MSGERSKKILSCRWRGGWAPGNILVSGQALWHVFETVKGGAFSACPPGGAGEEEGPTPHCIGKSTASALETKKWARQEVWSSAHATDGNFRVAPTAQLQTDKSQGRE